MTLEHGEPHAQPAAGHVADREGEAEGPVDAAGEREEQQRQSGEAEDAEHLHRVAADQIQAGQGGCGKDEEADSGLHEAAVDADPEEAERQQTDSQGRGLLVRFLAPREESPQGHDDHQRREHPAESVVADEERGPGAQPGAGRRRQRGPQDGPPVEHAVAVEAPRGDDVLQQDGDPVRAVGDAGRETEEDEDRQREEGAASRDHVQRAGDAAGQRECGVDDRRLVHGAEVSAPKVDSGLMADQTTPSRGPSDSSLFSFLGRLRFPQLFVVWRSSSSSTCSSPTCCPSSTS